MTRSNVKIEDLVSVLEEIRISNYPEIPAKLIKDIVDVQFDNQKQDERPKGKKETKKLIDTFLKNIVDV